MPDPNIPIIRLPPGGVTLAGGAAAQPAPTPTQPAPATTEPATVRETAPLEGVVSHNVAELKLTPVAQQNIVTVGGQLGVFTPLTHPPGTATDPDAEKNVQIVVSALQTEVAGLSQENFKLKGQLEKSLGQPRSPEDFATAVQRSLDKLQLQLSAMTNPVCNFAVREFRLETNVHVTITSLGDVEYRFVSMNERPDPGTLSRIVLDLAPLPKQNTAGTFARDLFKPATAVSEIEGLTPDEQAALHQNQIDTVGDLVATGTRARSSVELAGLLKIDRAQLAGLVSRAELLTIQGVDGARASVLAQAGAGSMTALAALSPDDLAARFNAQVAQAARTDLKPIDSAEAAMMVKAAKAYLGRKPSPDA
jgi:hypothetical protein